MAWIQNLYETYEACAESVGLSAGNQEKMLLPLGHTLMTTDIVVYLKNDGTFDRAEKDKVTVGKRAKKGTAVCAPCMYESESRTRNATDCPHPLFDQIKHLTGAKYLENLSKWREYLKNKPGHVMAYNMLTVVYKYMESATLKDDLESCQIEFKDENGVRFSVYVADQPEYSLWLMPGLWAAWSDYYQSEYLDKSKKKSLCYILGKDNLTYTDKHPKNINRSSGNAKLISGNDNKNFTYRGRFAEASQAVTVSYEASQKAHQALRWLIANQGYCCGEQAIVAWAIDAKHEVLKFYDDSCDIYESLSVTDSDRLMEARHLVGPNYADILKEKLLGLGGLEKFTSYKRRVAVMALDAATPGRMSVTYYRELGEGEYIERVVNWHVACKWPQSFKKKDGQYLPFIGAPSNSLIIEAVLGKERTGRHKNEAYDKLEKTLRERLLHCMFDGERIPRDMVNAAVRRASNPQAFEKTEAKGSADRWQEWEEILGAACALVRCFYYTVHDDKKENFEVTLEKDRTTRDYLYGRLLAVADKLESSAMYKQDRSKNNARATNALRYMPQFSQHPKRTWNMLFSQQLNPYIQQLNGASWHLNLIDEIMGLFRAGEFDSDKPLGGAYLLGFSAQRLELRKKREDDKKNKNGGQENESDEQN